ncbi:MAG: MurR/RpiR family transcriptional regulator [Carbonactinosporaceae bacterium]
MVESTAGERFSGRRLSPAHRRIAQYLLDHVPDAAFLSSVDLAARVGVSQPSVTRFAVTLGFRGYPALRHELRRIVLDSGAQPAAGGNGLSGNRLLATVRAESAHLESLEELVADPRAVADLGVRLAASRPLAVLGLWASTTVARSFADDARRVHPDVRALVCGGGRVEEGLLEARAAGAEWLLAFVLPPYPVESVRALAYARTIGIGAAVVTDNALAPFRDDADVLLRAGVTSTPVSGSRAAPYVLAALLVEAMADATPRETRRRLGEHERLVERRHVFLP